MNSEIQTIVTNLQDILAGNPWYGKAVYELLDEADVAKVYDKPNSNSHSLIDLLYHLLTWAEFAEQRLAKKTIKDMAAFEAQDWRVIDPAVHDWQKGIAALKASHRNIIEMLQTKDDTFLSGQVDYRRYDFRYLLNGLIQHNIYHLGQLAYLIKLLAGYS